MSGITFLDEDHVLRVARVAMGGGDAPGLAWLRGFFAPEQVDPAPLIRAANGLGPVDAPEQASVLMLRRAAVDEALLARCPRLRLVQRLGERRHGVDVAAAAARGIHVSCLPRPSLAVTAEHAILLMLALGKQLRAGDAMVRRGAAGGEQGSVAYNWAGLAPLAGLYGRSLGIVGLGEVGALVARLGRAFGMRLLYCNRRRLADDVERDLGAAYRPLDALLAEADFVSLHASNLPENEGAFGERQMRTMRRDAFLVNTSRGALVDEAALLRALEEGWIAGAGLDVHAMEPRPPGDPLCALPNVVLTPHVAGGSRLGVIGEVMQMLENCHAVLAGSPPPHGRVLP